MTLKALFQDLRCWIWVLWLASWPDKDYLNCSVHQSSSITLNSSSLSRIAGRGWAFPNTQLIVTLKIASLIISPGGPFPSYGRKQGTFEIISHLNAINHLFCIGRRRWLEVKTIQVAVQATTGPVVDQTLKSARLSLHLSTAELPQVRCRPLSSKFSFPDQCPSCSLLPSNRKKSLYFYGPFTWISFDCYNASQCSCLTDEDKRAPSSWSPRN